jgi:hypothetical protein
MEFQIIDIDNRGSQWYLRNFRRNATFNENVNRKTRTLVGHISPTKSQIVQMKFLTFWRVITVFGA